MRLDDEPESDNVIDDRGNGGGGGGFGGFGGGGFGGGGGGMLPLLFGLVGSRFGCGGVVVLAIIVAVFGGFGSLGGMLGGGGGAPRAQIGQPQDTVAPAAEPGQPAAAPGEEDTSKKFVRKVLYSTEQTWAKLLPAQTGVRYVDPKLVLYNGRDNPGGCGPVSSASGPFYCPEDRRVYLDTSFFNELSQRFGAPGDFADAYVIAHEVGHHVQNLLGISAKAEAAMQNAASSRQRNAISVRLELQADCLAGVWASANPGLLSPGDVDQAVKAATAIGDDRLQQAAQGTVVPDSFTHGTSAQRVHWLETGLQSGRIDACDTFKQAP